MPTGIYTRTKPHSRSMLGKHHTLEAREKISKARKGIKFTEEHKLNISKAKLGDKNPTWKGDNVGYGGIHAWVVSKLGKPRECDNCDNTKLNHRQYHWANLSGEYKRDLTDWARLCCSCHAKFDGIGNNQYTKIQLIESRG